MIRRSSLDRRRSFGRRMVRDRRRDHVPTLRERRSGAERRHRHAWRPLADRRSGAERRL
jgi:hypothetical protein